MVDNPCGTRAAEPGDIFLNLTILNPALLFALTIACIEVAYLVPIFNVLFCESVSLYRLVILAAVNGLS